MALCSVEAGNGVMFSGSSKWGRYVQWKQVMRTSCSVEQVMGMLYSVEAGNGDVMFTGSR
jgi:hypothetical protein